MTERHHFLISPDAVRNARFRFNGNEAHHLSKVARVQVGDRVTLLDGSGSAYEAVVGEIRHGEVMGTIESVTMGYQEPSVSLHLGIGILKGCKMDIVVEKGTELGISSITPVDMKFNVKREINLSRLGRIARSAVKQCGRGRIPRIREPVEFRTWLSEMAAGYAGAVDYGSDTAIWSWLTQLPEEVSDLLILIGPEGGFHEEEKKLLKKNSIAFVSLGPRRLRSETAAISAITLCDAFFERRRNDV